MYYHIGATENFFQAIDSVDTLIDFAIKENNEGRIKNHDFEREIPPALPLWTPTTTTEQPQKMRP
jgi:hypothetical protein